MTLRSSSSDFSMFGEHSSPDLKMSSPDFDLFDETQSTTTTNDHEIMTSRTSSPDSSWGLFDGLPGISSSRANIYYPVHETPSTTTTSDNGIMTPRTSSSKHNDSADDTSGSRFTIPEPGKIYRVHHPDTKKVIALVEGKVELQQTSAQPGEGSFWTCVENNGWLGFRNSVSGTYLGLAPCPWPRWAAGESDLSQVTRELLYPP